MATALGTAIFRGQSGQGYVKDLFITDTANALCTWDQGAGASATSAEYWEPPEAVTLEQYIQATATGQTRTRVTVNDNPTQSLIRNSQHIPSATIIGTPYLGIKFPAGVKIGLQAIA